jgi:uncharacterized cupredoxin-like copper-binding protein
MKKILFLLVGICLIITACGGKNGGVSTNVNITMTDFQFSPNSFTVPAGKEISLKAENSGAVVHSFVIMNEGKSAGTEFNDEDTPNVYWQIEIQPGGSTDTTFTAPSQPGEYEIVCHVPGHLQAGMVGKLNVVAEH